MIILCLLYCVPFAAFMYYAIAPLAIMLSCYLLKRGMCRGILWQRQFAVLSMFISVVKIFLFDLQEVVGNNILYQGINFTIFLFCLVILYIFYERFGKNYRFVKRKPKNDRDLRAWSNTSMMSVILLICWELLPWVGYLMFGQAPDIFSIISWRLIAAFNFVTLVTGFWLSEEYYWYYNDLGKKKKCAAVKVWVPSDTLWLCLPLYLMALAFGIMGDDILK